MEKLAVRATHDDRNTGKRLFHRGDAEAQSFLGWSAGIGAFFASGVGARRERRELALGRRSRGSVREMIKTQVNGILTAETLRRRVFRMERGELEAYLLVGPGARGRGNLPWAGGLRQSTKPQVAAP